MLKAATAFSRSSPRSPPTGRCAARASAAQTAMRATPCPRQGLHPRPPKALPAPDDKTVATMAQTWSRLNLGTRLLTLLDVSGTMALPVPGTNLTRMQAISKIAPRAWPLPRRREIGVWKFSTHLDGQGKDWRELVSVGPLSESVNGVLRKDALAKQFATVQAKATGDTGLNDTLKAAYAEMT